MGSRLSTSPSSWRPLQPGAWCPGSQSAPRSPLMQLFAECGLESAEIRDPGFGEWGGSKSCTERCLRGWRESCISEEITPGATERAPVQCLPPAQGNGSRSATHTGVEWGVGGGEHSRAAPHSRALCSAACNRAESPRSPACIFGAAAACARPFPCPRPTR